MRQLVTAAFLLLLTATAAHAWPGRVVRVSDGDTVHVEPVKGGDRIKVRLYGIDCPESRQPYGEAATGFVNDTVLFQVVEVEEKDRDKYGRTVAILYMADGSTLQDGLLENGLAWVFTRYCKSQECTGWKDKEKAAAKARKGLWRGLDGKDRPVAPWAWRKGGK